MAEPIIFITGLPCIGKTRMLVELCQKWNARLVQFDILRQQVMPRTSHSEILSSQALGFAFSGFPLTATEWFSLIESTERFLSFHAWQAQTLSADLFKAFDAECDCGQPPVVCEISPFVLSALPPQNAVVMCTVDRELHIKRIISRVCCSRADAKVIEEFLSRAFALIRDQMQIVRAISLQSLPSELRNWLNSQ